MPVRRRVALLTVAVSAPFFFGAIPVAAGHVVPARLPFYVDHLDTAVILFNALVASVIAGTAAFLVVPRRQLGVVVGALAFATAIPAYTLSYLFLVVSNE